MILKELHINIKSPRLMELINKLKANKDTKQQELLRELKEIKNKIK